MANKKVLILGASRYYALSIEAARKAGYHVIAVDQKEGSYGFRFADEYYVCDIVDKEAILDLAKRLEIDAIVPINDYGVPTAAFVAEHIGIAGISQETALWATSKNHMRNKWVEKGIPCPQVHLALTRADFEEGIEKIGFPCIFKPAHGYGGASRGVIVVNKSGELDEAIEFTQKFYDNKETLIESFIEAEVEHSAEVIVYKGEPHVIAIADKVKTPLPYRVDKNVIYPTRIEGHRLQELKTVIKDSVIALGIDVGAAHVEMATIKDGFVLFELGARCGGGGTPAPIVPYATGVEEFVETVRVLAGDEPRQLKPSLNRGCNYHFITPKPGIISSIKGEETVRNHENVLDFDLFVKPGDKINEVTVGTERAGFIIATGENREEAFKIGYKLEEEIVFTIEE